MPSMNKRLKLSLLVGLLRQNPREASDRVLTFVERHADRLRREATLFPVQPTELGRRLGEALGGDLGPFLHEAPLLEIERQVVEGRRALSANPAFEMIHA